MSRWFSGLRFFLSVNMYCVFRALWHCILLCCCVWVFQWLIYSLPFLSVSIPVCLRRSWTTKLQLFLGEVMRSSKLFKAFSRNHPGIQHFSPNSSRNCYCWVNMLTCKLIITCGRHVSGFWQLESELHSHNLLISSDKWSTHRGIAHCHTALAHILSKSISFIFPFPYSFVLMRFCSDTPLPFSCSLLVQLRFQIKIPWQQEEENYTKGGYIYFYIIIF